MIVSGDIRNNNVNEWLVFFFFFVADSPPWSSRATNVRIPASLLYWGECTRQNRHVFSIIMLTEGK